MRDLKKRGVSRDIIDSVLQSIPPDKEESDALRMGEFLLKQYRTSRKRINRLKQQQRMKSSLLRRGFDFTTIRKVMSKLFTAAEIEESDES